ncbi:deaminase domain-containing protein [Priestia megaterium]
MGTIKIKGRILLFAELDRCESCSEIIVEFATKYKNIEYKCFLLRNLL